MNMTSRIFVQDFSLSVSDFCYIFHNISQMNPAPCHLLMYALINHNTQWHTMSLFAHINGMACDIRGPHIWIQCGILDPLKVKESDFNCLAVQQLKFQA